MRKPRASISVLVVDDDRDARTMYRIYLKHVGCTVRTARDGHVAITKANKWTPDVIVMDLAMPRLDGWTASRWLKSSPATAHIPIIALSAACDAREDARAAGCDGYVAKPFSPRQLLAKVREFLP